MDWVSDAHELEDFDWSTDEDTNSEEKQPIVCSPGSTEPGTSWLAPSRPSREACEASPSHSFARTISWEAVAGPSTEVLEAGASFEDVMSHFLGMGFAEEMVEKAIDESGLEDTEAILEALLTYTAIENHEKDISDDLSDNDGFGSEEPAKGIEKDRILSTLVDMGFLAEEASAAINRCGPNASVLELADSIHAAQMAEESDGPLRRPPRSCPIQDEPVRWCAQRFPKYKRRFREETRNSRPRQYKQQCKKRLILDDDEPSFSFPNPMIGFGLPLQKPVTTYRKLPDAAIGPPYFYFENVALAPKGVWDTISRFLYDIEPEYVDSKYFSVANRKRGYIHNLPISNRFPLKTTRPRTIQEEFPATGKWWPEWDRRTHFNCIQTCIASAKLTERIRSMLASSTVPPSPEVQRYVLEECRRWNLVWVGSNRVAPLEPDEIETILGFPKDHTRGGGISRTERYRSLGNSFQVDTVAYHLSVLKDLFPNGITVLSLFSGIGGGEVALHQLGIQLKAVVAVEISEVNRNILRSWWEQTNQTGVLIDYADVQELNGDNLAQLIRTYGGFDLVIGGSPCNNLSGANRHTRDGLQGEHSSLFYEYSRILELVKEIMKGS